MDLYSVVFLFCMWEVFHPSGISGVIAFSAGSAGKSNQNTEKQRKGVSLFDDDDAHVWDSYNSGDTDVQPPQNSGRQVGTDGGGFNAATGGWGNDRGVVPVDWGAPKGGSYSDFGIDPSDALGTYDPISNTFIPGFTGDGQGMDIPNTGNSDKFLNTYFSGASFDPVASSVSNNNMFGIVCPEKCACMRTKVDCAGQNLTSVPKGISPLTTWLDLSMNNLQRLPEKTFAEMTNLKELRCVGNNLTKLPKRLFKHNNFLQLLNFQGNRFSKVPPRAFQNLHFLLELHLDANEIESIPKKAFLGLTSLKQLWLDANKLDHVPVTALRELTGLQALALTMNQITKLPDFAFQNNTRLIQLRLANNQIDDIADQAFYGLSKLKYLQIHQNRIETMPSAFSHLTALDELNLEDNRLSHIPDKSFQFKDKLTTLKLRNNQIKSVGDKAFVNLPSLQELKLSEVLDMTTFPDLTGTMNLTVLQLDRAFIKSLPKDLCGHLKKLKTFDVHSNKIGTIPEMSQCKYLTILNMANNELTSLEGQLFNGMDHLKDLTLSLNFIQAIAEDSFLGLGALEYLNLAENKISKIHPKAFLPLKSLKDLNLGQNQITNLPTAGLVSLEKLKVFHNPGLREFPPKEEFPHVNNFILAYAYHCCDFIHSRPEQVYLDMIREYVIWMKDGEPDQLAMWERYENESRLWENIFENHTIENDLWESFTSNEYDLSDYGLGREATTYLEDYKSNAYDHNYAIAKAAISCKPKPGPFMPCDDLFGWWSLRCGVWFVFMLALLGNGVVFFVSVTSKSKMDVPRFLICNLAVADFFMGIYLGILAIMDASTLGQFKKYAIQWQMSAGCLVAGTLGVLSSELSVFTLTVITLERFYAITHAMQLNKRLSLKHAGFIMAGGWIWSFGLAILPLFGISDYRKFAVCLPFEIEDVISKSYVCFIMVFNGISFFIILTCYLIMYLSIRDSQAWNSNDTRVAKRMALLVFTDFLCWAPIAFLSLAASFGKNLIHLNEAKVLTIFILPLNSCANPFLYAFFTKQFKKDCVLLCRRLEDSSIARHFSQVSQRHVSMSWKHQRRPSGLRSLMGEGKSSNCINKSTGSNSYGLVNYNSEISTGSQKEAEKEALNMEKFVQSSSKVRTRENSIINNSNSKQYKHKYQVCPGGVCSDEKNTSNTCCHRGAERPKDIFNENDAHVILHQDFYSQSGTETNAWTTETFVNDDEEAQHGLKPPVSQTLNNNGDKENMSEIKKKRRRLTQEETVSSEEDCVWTRRSEGPNSLELSRRSPVRDVDRCSSNAYPGDRDSGTGSMSKTLRSQEEKGKTSFRQINGENGVEKLNDNGTCGEVPGKDDIQAWRKCSMNDAYSSCNGDLQHGNGKDPGHSKPKEQIAKYGEEGGKHHKTHGHGWRQSLQCCSANSSPSEPRGHMHSFDIPHGEKKKGQNIEYVMWMPTAEDATAKKKENCKICCTDATISVTTEKQVDISQTSIFVKEKDLKDVESIKNNHKGATASSSYDKHKGVKATSQPGTNPLKVSRSEHKGKSSKHSKRHRHHHGHHKRGHQGVELRDRLNTNSASKKQFPNSSSPLPLDRVLPQELLHKHTAIDKSIHLHYFQQSIAGNGHKFVCKSNSLVELTQAQIEEARLPKISNTKRRSLTPRQEGYMLLQAESAECPHQNFHQYHSHYSDYLPFSGMDEERNGFDGEFPPMISLEKYFEGRTTQFFDERNQTFERTGVPATKVRTRTKSHDWEEAGTEEIGVLLDESDEDNNHDSYSSTRTSADKESGFHSQA